MYGAAAVNANQGMIIGALWAAFDQIHVAHC
jgi:hypothetical protein